MCIHEYQDLSNPKIPVLSNADFLFRWNWVCCIFYSVREGSLTLFVLATTTAKLKSGQNQCESVAICGFVSPCVQLVQTCKAFFYNLHITESVYTLAQTSLSIHTERTVASWSLKVSVVWLLFVLIVVGFDSSSDNFRSFSTISANSGIPVSL